MKKQTYKLSNLLPAYTTEQWLQSYKDYLAYIYSTPKSHQKGYNWEQLMNLMTEIKSFLKSKKVKFI